MNHQFTRMVLVLFVSGCGWGDGARQSASIAEARDIVSSTGNRTYTTGFALNESPISESGVWINGGTLGLDWTNVSTSGGRAIGHQVGPRFSDATALVSGEWKPDQRASATIFSDRQDDACYQELELRLRSTIRPHLNTGYEVSYKNSRTAQAYLIIVRWNGRLGDFTELYKGIGKKFAVSTGDIMSATIVGDLITAYKNGVALAAVRDSSYFTGNPGMGFNLENAPPGCTGTNADYGFTDFIATDSLGTQKRQ